MAVVSSELYPNTHLKNNRSSERLMHELFCYVTLSYDGRYTSGACQLSCLDVLYHNSLVVLSVCGCCENLQHQGENLICVKTPRFNVLDFVTPAWSDD